MPSVVASMVAAMSSTRSRIRGSVMPKSWCSEMYPYCSPWAGTASSSILPGEHSNAPVDFGVPLGWTSGPNSARLDWIHRQDLSERWSWTLTVRALWKGTGSGSSVSDLDWRDSAGTWTTARMTKKWLSGALIERQDVSLLAERRLAGAWRITFGGGLSRLSVPDRDVRWIPAVRTVVSWNE